jgi:hypothetical protein
MDEVGGDVVVGGQYQFWASTGLETPSMLLLKVFEHVHYDC